MMNILEGNYPEQVVEGSYHNMDPVTVGAISEAIGGIGNVVGGVFGWMGEKKKAESAETQAQYQAILEQNRRKQTINIVIGVTAVALVGTASWILIKRYGK